jgi:hypothetical protein
MGAGPASPDGGGADDAAWGTATATATGACCGTLLDDGSAAVGSALPASSLLRLDLSGLPGLPSAGAGLAESAAPGACDSCVETVSGASVESDTWIAAGSCVGAAGLDWLGSVVADGSDVAAAAFGVALPEVEVAAFPAGPRLLVRLGSFVG